MYVDDKIWALSQCKTTMAPFTALLLIKANANLPLYLFLYLLLDINYFHWCIHSFVRIYFTT